MKPLRLVASRVCDALLLGHGLIHRLVRVRRPLPDFGRVDAGDLRGPLRRAANVIFALTTSHYSHGSNARMTFGSSSIFMTAKSAEPASLSDAPTCQAVLSAMMKRSCDFLYPFTVIGRAGNSRA